MKAMQSSDQDRYLIKSLAHASQILHCFQGASEVLRLRDVIARTGFKKGMCFRLVYTLHQCGFLEKVGENHYRLVAEWRPRRRYRIGYAAVGDGSFPQEVHNGLVRAADREQVELMVISNRYQPRVALRNANHLIREHVDLVIEFQCDESIAPAVASRFLEANIPFIAIDIPHPGGTYFGANNYDAGLLAGRALGRWAKRHWEGVVDEILLLEISRAGSLPRARLRGMLAGVQEHIANSDCCRTVYLDGDGQFKPSLERVRKHLRESKVKRMLLCAANDQSALGALRAFEEAGRAPECAVASHNGEPDARAELRTPRSRLIATVGYFPEKYGDGLIRLALDILGRKAVPPAVFIKHQVLTPDNVDHYYPNDILMGGAASAGPVQPVAVQGA